MSKSKIILEQLAKLVEKGFINYKDLSTEMSNILKSKRDDFVFNLRLTSKEETDILKKRIEVLEKTLLNKKKKSRKVKKS